MVTSRVCETQIREHVREGEQIAHLKVPLAPLYHTRQYHRIAKCSRIIPVVRIKHAQTPTSPVSLLITES
jgi:hypothetical protein